MTPTPSKKFRVLIVDDSAFMRKVLETIFNADAQLQVVGHAKDGREAVSMAESLKPDVITMDINMPRVDGLQATAEIMTTNPRPIVIVSSDSKEGAASTLRALELGAIEFVGKPSGAIDLDMQSVKEERSEEHTSELQSLAYLVCRLLLEKKKKKKSNKQIEYHVEWSK